MRGPRNLRMLRSGVTRNLECIGVEKLTSIRLPASSSEEAAGYSGFDHRERDQRTNTANDGKRDPEKAISDGHIDRATMDETTNDLDHDADEKAEGHTQPGAGDGEED